MQKKQKEMYMEDVGSISTDTTEFVASLLAEFNLELKDEDADKIFECVQKIVENYCINDYKHHM